MTQVVFLDIIIADMIDGTNDTRYAFVNGIVRAKEARLLKKSHFDRLIEAGIESFKPILSDTPYTGAGDLLNTLSDVEKQERSFFEKFCLHSEIRDMVLLPDMVHNLKVRLKNGDASLLYDVRTEGLESSEEVKAIIADFYSHRNAFIMSTELDKFMCKKFNELSMVSEFFRCYFQLYFDLENIRSFFRARKFESPKEIFKQVYIRYGTIPEKKFLENIDKDMSVVAREFHNTSYGTLIENGGNYLETQGSFLRLERLCDETRLQFLKIARYYTFGVEPLFGYYQFKMAEIKRLRQVYMGKEYNIPVNQLKESIPDAW